MFEHIKNVVGAWALLSVNDDSKQEYYVIGISYDKDGTAYVVVKDREEMYGLICMDDIVQVTPKAVLT